MEKENKIINFDLNDFEQEGLYLIFPDLSRVVLTRERIQKITKEYWENPEKISPKVKTAVEFQRCPFCPLKGQKDFCDALRPILPFLEVIDKYVSFDKVTAIYKSKNKELYHVADTTMQEALKFVSTMSLMQYCQIGRKYWKYYLGIMPLIGGQEMARRLFLNIYWLNKGDMEAINKTIAIFDEQIRITANNQVKRMNLICKNDAFMNAFVNTQAATMFLSMDIQKSVAKAFDEFEQEIPL